MKQTRGKNFLTKLENMSYDFGRVSGLENLPPDPIDLNDTTNPDQLLSVIQEPPRIGNWETHTSFYASQPSWMNFLNRKGQKLLESLESS